ncbi:MAG: cobyric acid synthase, partial [Nitrospiraceae bacterium]
MAARTLMIQGTASHVGKSVLVSALCRLFVRQGLRVAPFKAQNMSNNSFVTPDGKEIGRAQAVQAAACRLEPRTDFNPVLIKPEGEQRAQVVVEGEVAGSLVASEFGRVRREYFPTVRKSFARLAEEFDLVILEGAGSPAEINLRDQDIVNMRMAREAQAPVLLVGDIDRGGVFAALVGTLTLLTAEERRYVKGFLINKFRGDNDLLAPGVKMVEEQVGLSCLGILPHWGALQVPEEDSLGWNHTSETPPSRADALVIGVADLPAISNFTDFEALSCETDVHLLRVAGPTNQRLDALIFPGTKNTAHALRFVKTSGLDHVARRVVTEGGTVVGICGGYQILGKKIRDPRGIESQEREMEGLGLLDVVTSFARKKVLIRVIGIHRDSGSPIDGYQVHMGRTRAGREVVSLLEVEKPDHSRRWSEGAMSPDGLVLGTYVHGLFDAPQFRRTFLNGLRARRGWRPLDVQARRTLDQSLDDLA